MTCRPLLVMKFGGTSLGSSQRLRNVAAIVTAVRDSGYAPVVVCSAMSDVKKASGTTALLLKAAEQALSLSTSSAHQTGLIHSIRDNHIAAARDAILLNGANDRLLADLIGEVTNECEKLEVFLRAVSTIKEISPRSKDIIISTGEKLSCMMLTAVLQSIGTSACAVNLAQIVQKEFNSSFLDQSFYDYLAEKCSEAVLNNTLSKSSDKCSVPVVTGFLGPVPGSLLSTIGRGYTDLTAALLSVGLNALELQIWKEVDGIFTADPRKVPAARLLPTIFPEEVAELTYYGSEVIHPFTMDQVIRSGIHIRIKNTFNPSNEGTLIVSETPRNNTEKRQFQHSLNSICGTCHQCQLPLQNSNNIFNHVTPIQDSHLITTLSKLPIVNSLSPLPLYTISTPIKYPTALTIKDSILVINIRSNRKISTHGFLRSIFGILDQYGIIVDMISTSEVHVSMAIPVAHSHTLDIRTISRRGSNSQSELVNDEDQTTMKINSNSHSHEVVFEDVNLPQPLQRVIHEFKKLGTVSYIPGQVILSVVGKDMRNMVGTAGKMFSILAAEGVNIEMISQGASEINISCVISESSSSVALRSVHDQLICGVPV